MWYEKGIESNICKSYWIFCFFLYLVPSAVESIFLLNKKSINIIPFFIHFKSFKKGDLSDIGFQLRLEMTLDDSVIQTNILSHQFQVSFFSTSPELSNKQRFEYFTRTIPSDHYQVKAMVDIVVLLKWNYISIIYEESNYGIKVRVTNVCVFIKSIKYIWEKRLLRKEGKINGKNITEAYF